MGVGGSMPSNSCKAASNDPQPVAVRLTCGDVESYKVALLMRLTTEVQERQRKISQQQFTLEEKDARISHQELHIEKLREAGQSIRQDNAQIAGAIVRLEALNQQLKDENSAMRSQQTMAAEEKSRLHVEIEASEAKGKASEKERDEYERQCKLLSLDKKHLKADLAKLKGLTDELKQENGALKAEIEELREAGQTIRQDSAQIVGNIVRLEALHQQLKDENSAMRSQQTMAAEEQSRLQVEIEALEAKVQASEKERHECEKQCKLLILDKEVKVQASRRERDEYEKQCKLLSLDKEHLKLDLAKLKGLTDELKQENGALKAEIEELREAGQTIRQENVQIVSDVVRLEALNQQLKDENSAMRSQQTMAAEEKSRLQVEIEGLEAKVQASEKERDECEKQCTLLSLHKEHLEVDFAALKGITDELKQQNGALKAEIEELRFEILRVSTASLDLGTEITQASSEVPDGVCQEAAPLALSLVQRDQEVLRLQDEVAKLKDHLAQALAAEADVADKLKKSRLAEGLLRQSVADPTNCPVASGAGSPGSGCLSPPGSGCLSPKYETFRALAAEHTSTLHTLSTLWEQHRALQAEHASEQQAHASMRDCHRQLQESESTWKRMAEVFRRNLGRAADPRMYSTSRLADGPLDCEQEGDFGTSREDSGALATYRAISQPLSARRASFEPRSRSDDEEPPTEELKKVLDAKRRYEARKALAKQQELKDYEDK